SGVSVAKEEAASVGGGFRGRTHGAPRWRHPHIKRPEVPSQARASGRQDAYNWRSLEWIPYPPRISNTLAGTPDAIGAPQACPKRRTRIVAKALRSTSAQCARGTRLASGPALHHCIPLAPATAGDAEWMSGKSRTRLAPVLTAAPSRMADQRAVVH